MNYKLLLTIDKKDPLFQVYTEFGKALEINGHTFLDVSCDQIDSDAHYVQLRLTAPETIKGLVVWIPHRYVLFVYGDDQDRKIGFLNA